MDAVVAEIVAGRPPVNAITQATSSEADRETLGSNRDAIEKPIATGISAGATTTVASTFVRGFASQCRTKPPLSTL